MSNVVENAEAATVEEGSEPVEAATVETENETLGESGMKALKEERARARELARVNAELADKVREFEDRDKSEEQKRVEEAERLKAEIAELKRAKVVAEVANSVGVPVELVAGPRSDSAEDVQAYADALKEWRGTQAEAVKPSGVVPTIGQSPRVGNVPLKDQIAAAEAAGDKALVAALKAQQLGAVN